MVTHVTPLPGLMFNTRHISLLGECLILWWGGVLLPGKRGRLLSLQRATCAGCLAPAEEQRVLGVHTK